MMLRLLTMTSLVLLPACTSPGASHDAATSLDVSMDSGKAAAGQNGQLAGATLSSGTAAKKDPAGSVTLPPTAVINWQTFFRPPPSQAQRTVLAARLERWSDHEKPDDLVVKGRLENALGRTSAAEANFRKALRLSGDDHHEAMLELAAIALKRKKLQEAFDLFARLKLKIDTSDAITQSFIFRYRYTLAMAYLAREERQRGHDILSDLIGVDKAFTPAYAALAASYLATGKDHIAEFIARRGLDRSPDAAPLYNVLGVVARRSHQSETARRMFDKALEAQPAFLPALVNRAALNAEGLEYGAAEQDLLVALSLDPNNVDALVALGVVQRKQGNLNGATLALTKAVDLAPDDAFARFNLAILMASDLKRPSEASRLFSEVLQTRGASLEIQQLARRHLNDLRPDGKAY